MALCAVILAGLALPRTRRPRKNSYLIRMAGNTFLLLAVLLAGTVPGRWQAAVRSVTTFGYYFLICFPTFWWVGYVTDSLGGGKKRPGLFPPLYLPLAAELLLVLLTPSTGCLYRIDASNVYHNGWLLPLFAALNISYSLYAMLLAGLNRRLVDSGTWVFLLFCPLIPTFFGLLQTRRNNYDLLWPSVALMLTVLYFRELDHTISIDYLTGLYNRMQVDEYITVQMRRSSPQRTFSGIMIDVDNFKEINDCFGHQTGDEALLATSRLLRKTIGRRNFLARYGGDEFIAVLHTGSYRELTETVRRIDAAFARFSDSSSARYRLGVSMGYDVYSGEAYLSRQQFIRHIDRLMYMEKRKKREDVVKADR